MKKTLLLAAAGALLMTACVSVEKGGGHAVDASVADRSASEEKTPEYKKLVYGEEKPLVCTDPIFSEGGLKNRPNLQLMWENYLYDRPEGIWGGNRRAC